MLRLRRHDRKNKAEQDVEAAWAAGDWQASLPAAALQMAQNAPTPDNFYLALKIQHAINGLAEHDIDAFSQLLELTPDSLCWSRVALRLLCASLQIEKPEFAHDVVARYLSGRCPVRQIRALLRFPLALAFLSRHYPEKLRVLQRKHASHATALLENTKAIDGSWIAACCDSNGPVDSQRISVAVVGNGPSLLQHPHGRTIDHHDAVIRFNNPVLTDAYQHHSGVRTDLRIVSPNLAKRTPYSDVAGLGISGINILHGESGYWQRLATLTGELKLAVFDQHIWYDLVAALKAPPSAGLMTLACLESQVFLQISAFGFTSDAEAGLRPDHIHDDAAGSHYGDANRASTRHDWTAEAALISELVERSSNITLC